MIADKFVDLYARNSGLRDKLVAERDVVLTNALRALEDSGVMQHLAFKGGSCLRKTVFGSSARSTASLHETSSSNSCESFAETRIAAEKEPIYADLSAKIRDPSAQIRVLNQKPPI